MRRHACHRLFARLALLAMLSLALLPALGRLAGSPAPTALHAAMAGAGTRQATHPHGAPAAHGHSTVHAEPGGHAAPPASTPFPGTPLPVPGGHGGHDCPYCPLLSSLTAALIAPLPEIALPADVPPRAAFAIAVPATPRRGLGARGPPRA